MLEVGSPAPLFTAQTQDGKEFSLESRRSVGWTVLFFYPKAETPGCTKQACAFRDSIKVIRELNAEVFGVSSDTVERQAKFHANHHLQFDLIADPEDKIINQYGAKMPLLSMAKRWTFVIDPDLVIRSINKNVDPAADAAHVAEIIRGLQGSSR